MFRPEALEHRAQTQVAGGVLRSGPRWAERAFWLLLALVVVALVAGTLIRIDRYVTAPSMVAPNGRVQLLVSATAARSLEPGRTVDVGGTEAEVKSISSRELDPALVKERFGIDVAVPSVAVTTTLTGGNAAVGTGRVLIGSQPVVVALVPGLDALLGSDDG
jgi:hypothetical protein